MERPNQCDQLAPTFGTLQCIEPYGHVLAHEAILANGDHVLWRIDSTTGDIIIMCVEPASWYENDPQESGSKALAPCAEPVVPNSRPPRET